MNPGYCKKIPYLIVCVWLLLSCNAPDEEIASSQAKAVRQNTVEQHLQISRQSEKQPNQLINESSPYLLLHAYNPVQWYPWGEEAFEQARLQNKPIFLSIGYSTCHWCHVMARESFENEDIASILNEHFISIKVDREERPDIDSVYMLATELINGHGGWPMTVFLNHELEPFHAGTYYPPVSRDNRMGLRELLLRVTTLWRDEKGRLDAVAGKVTALIKAEADHSMQGVAINEDVAALAFDQIASRFDDEYGGFSAAPKFPSPGIHALLRTLSTSSEKYSDDARRMLRETLTAMANGGIHDQVGGGFHRYSVDAQWQVPHFEKMLYTQALMALAYTGLYELENEQRYHDIVDATLQFVIREMRDEEGGFYSALDAESVRPEQANEKAEGAYYLWRATEIKRLLTNEEWLFIKNYFNIRDTGNIDSDPYDEFKSLNILYIERDEAGIGISDNQAKLLDSARNKLATARMERQPPHLDDKIITAWNGMMITALARAADVFDNDDYKKHAIVAAEFIRRSLLNAESYNLFRRSRLGEAGIAAGLDDYVWYVQALLALHKLTDDKEWLDLAEKLTERQVQLFYDEENGGFFESGMDKYVLFRSKSAYDGALPSPNAVALDNLHTLAVLTREKKWQQMADSTFDVFAASINASPVSAAWMLSVAELK